MALICSHVCARMARVARHVGARDGEFEPLTEYANDPVGFCRDILGIKLWKIQEQIAEALRDHPQVSVAACYASGKTYLAAALVLWWLYTRRPALVVTTAPTDRQVKKLLWRYIRKLHRKARIKLPGQLNQKELVISDDWQAFGFAGSSGHSVQGIHEASNVLFIEDEAAGMDPTLLEDFEGITTGEGSRHLKIGNPTVQSGPFYDAHENETEREHWKTFSISAGDTPNVQAGRTVIQGLVETEWVEKIRRRYGEDSPFWITKVLGKFFTAGSEQVIPLSWSQAALRRWDSEELARWDEDHPDEPLILGVDIGRTIDETVFATRQGRRVRVTDRLQTDDLTLIADRIEDAILDTGASQTNIDATGLGIGVWDILRRRIDDGVSRIPSGVRLCDVVLGRSPEDKDAFETLLDELQWIMREAFSPKNPEACAIEDEELATQLAARGWELTRKGKVKVDTKKELKRQGIDSPDLADAVMQTFYRPAEVVIF